MNRKFLIELDDEALPEEYRSAVLEAISEALRNDSFEGVVLSVTEVTE